MTAEAVPSTPADPRVDAQVHLYLGLHDLWLAFDQVRSRLAEELDLVPVDVSALLELHRSPGVRPGDLARRLNLKAAGTTSVTDRLVRTGYARRTADSSDRRGTRLDLTPAGEHAVGWVLEAMNRVVTTSGGDPAQLSFDAHVLHSLAGLLRPPPR